MTVVFAVTDWWQQWQSKVSTQIVIVQHWKFKSALEIQIFCSRVTLGDRQTPISRIWPLALSTHHHHHPSTPPPWWCHPPITHYWNTKSASIQISRGALSRCNLFIVISMILTPAVSLLDLFSLIWQLPHAHILYVVIVPKLDYRHVLFVVIDIYYMSTRLRELNIIMIMF